jgi:hypothetical protein
LAKEAKMGFWNRFGTTFAPTFSQGFQSAYQTGAQAFLETKRREADQAETAGGLARSAMAGAQGIQAAIGTMDPFTQAGRTAATPVLTQAIPELTQARSSAVSAPGLGQGVAQQVTEAINPVLASSGGLLQGMQSASEIYNTALSPAGFTQDWLPQYQAALEKLPGATPEKVSRAVKELERIRDDAKKEYFISHVVNNDEIPASEVLNQAILLGLGPGMGTYAAAIAKARQAKEDDRALNRRANEVQLASAQEQMEERRGNKLRAQAGDMLTLAPIVGSTDRAQGESLLLSAVKLYREAGDTELADNLHGAMSSLLIPNKGRDQYRASLREMYTTVDGRVDLLNLAKALKVDVGQGVKTEGYAEPELAGEDYRKVEDAALKAMFGSADSTETSSLEQEAEVYVQKLAAKLYRARTAQDKEAAIATAEAELIANQNIALAQLIRKKMVEMGLDKSTLEFLAPKNVPLSSADLRKFIGP